MSPSANTNARSYFHRCLELMNATGTFLTNPGLVPQPDGKFFRLDGDLKFRLPDGREIVVPKGFNTDLASIPPLGVLGGCVMAFAQLLSLFFWWAAMLAGIGLFICIVSAFLKTYGKFTRAAVLHDWLFQTHLFGFTISNWILLLAMQADHTPRWERFLIWLNVQLFALGIYRSDKRFKANFQGGLKRD